MVDWTLKTLIGIGLWAMGTGTGTGILDCFYFIPFCGG